MICRSEKNRFACLCGIFCTPSPEGIGTYNEKALHRVLKHFIEADTGRHEIKVGRYFADVLRDNEIVEIQTGSFYPLKNKIKYYLERTDYKIKIVYPIVKTKRLVRVDKDSGEILRTRMSPLRQKPQKLLPELFWLSEFLTNERLSFEVYEINMTEYRYSDTRVRYRKSGAYESESFPASLDEIYSFTRPLDFASLVPSELFEREGGFCAKDFMKLSLLSGKRAYAALNVLCSLGVLKKEKRDSAAAVYFKMEGDG